MPDVVERLSAALEGRYRVERELGQGGMATVYLAHDLRHDRRVALKVLRPDLAAVMGADRFLSEIRTTANLQHPHILPLHDSGDADGFLYYVMPYVEGESLRVRLDREKQLGVDEALRIAKAVGGALDYAHRHGVIHRDVKPENVLLHDGQPLVADFGIALAVSAAGAGRLTETGLSLGTPYYMSPEQATADRDPGPQSDVYSLGCMLYEMLVGDPPHTGSSAQAVLAKILTERPRPVTELRQTVPAHVGAAVARALERLPADRFETADAFVRALDDATFTHATAVRTGVAPMVAAPPGPVPRRAPWAVALPWGLTAVATAVVAWLLIREPTPAPQPTVRMTLSDFVVETTTGGGVRLAISRDGSTIVAGGEGGMLYQRRSDDTGFRPIPGTEGARNPSISPDGAWLAFDQRQGVHKVLLVGGPVLPVTDQGTFPHWFSQEEIVYDGPGGGANLISAAGGTPRALTDAGGRSFMLPGRRGLILDGPEGLVVQDLETGERTTIAVGGSNGRYLPTGHILYGDRTLQSVMAVPFDLEAMEVTGDPVPVLPSVNVFGGGAVQLAVSDNGTLIHGLAVNGGGAGQPRFTWIDLAGRRTDLALEAPDAAAPRFSPDGSRFVYLDGAADHLRVYNVLTGEATQVTDVARDFPTAAWSLDGTALFHSVGSSSGGWRWMRTAADGSGASEELVASAPGRINRLSPDGRWLIGEGDQATTSPDIIYARIDSGEVRVETYLRAEWHEEEGEVSPDGRWMAYVSSEGDEHAVYIRSFPVPGPATRVAEGGDPVWSPAGDALFYRRGARMLRRVVRLGDAVELGEETELFDVAGGRFSTQLRNYDLHPDGDRFLFVTVGAEEETPVAPIQGIGPVVLVVNWFEELRERMGEGR